MPSLTIRELYVAELTDLYDAEQQVLRELPLLAAGSTSPDLRDTFDEHYRQTLRHVERLEALFRYLDERPSGPGCRPLRALIEEARIRNNRLDRGAELDAALIALAQRIEHYEIAGYRSASTYAERLLDINGVDVLQETLAEENGMDTRLVALALAGSSGGASRLRPSTALRAS
jgi:ferritin-like metal-binding protein YciE